MLIAQGMVQRQEVKYPDECNPTCEVSFKADATWDNPYIYYKLENFYSSHRNWVEGKNLPQLIGNGEGSGSTSTCSPVKQNKDLSAGTTSLSGNALNPDDDAYPCGLTAKYFFSDSFAIKKSDGTYFSYTGHRVSLPFENDYFKNIKDDTERDAKQHIDLEADRTVVWYQVDIYPSFDRLFGELDGKIEKGETYTITVSGSWGEDDFDVTKKVVISGKSLFGGKEIWLGLLFTIAGIYCVGVLVVMIVWKFIGSANKKSKVHIPGDVGKW